MVNMESFCEKESRHVRRQALNGIRRCLFLALLIVSLTSTSKAFSTSSSQISSITCKTSQRTFRPATTSLFSSQSSSSSSSKAVINGSKKNNPTIIFDKLAIDGGKKKKKTTKEAIIDDSEEKSSWNDWMSGGKPRRRRRETDDVIMREAVALGGVPRSNRYSSRDWWHNTVTLPNSVILKAIRGPVIFMTSWATFLSMLYKHLTVTNPDLAQMMCVSSTPFSFMVSAMSLLLVFRTNSAYQRFTEGRKIWGQIVNSARDLYRMCMLYEREITKDKRRRLQRLLAAYPYLLRHRIRPTSVMHRVDDANFQRDPKYTMLLYQDKTAEDYDSEAAAVANAEEERSSGSPSSSGKSKAPANRRKTRPLYWVDKRVLPWRLLPSEALLNCARAQNRPLWVCDRMAYELRNVPDQGTNFTARERLALISLVQKLSNYIGDCERIHQTAVPLKYARHLVRALTLWLLLVPFALVKDFGYMTGPVLLLISWLLFGVYEIGYQIEDPFQGSIRLSIICDTIRRDILGDEFIRDTAFRISKPKKKDIEKKNNDEQSSSKSLFDSESDEDEDDDDDDYENDNGISNGDKESNNEDMTTSSGNDDNNDNGIGKGSDVAKSNTERTHVPASSSSSSIPLLLPVSMIKDGIAWMIRGRRRYRYNYR